MYGVRTRAAIVGLAILFTIGAPRAADKRPVAETDLFRFTWIADPQIAPDGSQVAFVRVVVNEKENRYETSIFLVPAAGGGEPRRITAGTRDTAPRGSPDGRRIAFGRNVEADGKPQASQLFVMQIDGREAGPLTDGPSGPPSPAGPP